MQRLPSVGVDIKDTAVRRWLIDLLKALSNTQEIGVYSVEVPWSIPMTLNVPYRSGGLRKQAPAIVRCADARLSADPSAPVAYGATNWTWNGDGTVEITMVHGLTLGTRYQLTFEVVG